MLQSVKGYYDNGVVVLDEPLGLGQKVPVIVTFLDEHLDLKQKGGIRKIGGFEGLVNIPADFNEPLDDLKEYMY